MGLFVKFRIIDAKSERLSIMPTPPDDLLTSLLSVPPTTLSLFIALAAIAVVGLALRVVLQALSKETDK
ncbi:hypothetical protein [Paracoccus sediminicola]|uniref:hypothetical protein n=1 Tax=Paracoccus sediminicola TaxID=3017783 RepID=UPI0022F0780B|nr:hypothetical protein [Paracoccus sediminicola]WBU58800.1 hypothetical protein PAF18_17450 [Paracoccus sediminicola]